MAKRAAAIGLSCLALASSAAAHPGHGRGGGDFSAMHYLGEPMHLQFAVPVLVLVALFGAHAVRMLRSRRRDRA